MKYLDLDGRKILAVSNKRVSPDQVEVDWDGSLSQIKLFNYEDGELKPKEESPAKLFGYTIKEIPRGSNLFIYSGSKFLGRVLDSEEDQLEIDFSESGSYEIKVTHDEWLTKVIEIVVS